MRFKLIVCVAVCVLTLSRLEAQPSFSLLWENSIFRKAGTDRAQSVAVLHNRTIVGEVLGRPDSEDTDVAVKAFNSTTGHLIWTDEFPGTWIRVATSHDIAIAVASIAPAPALNNLLLRAYSLRDGTIHWTSFATFDAPQQLLVHNGRLAIVGYHGQTRTVTPLSAIAVVFDIQ